MKLVNTQVRASRVSYCEVCGKPVMQHGLKLCDPCADMLDEPESADEPEAQG